MYTAFLKIVLIVCKEKSEFYVKTLSDESGHDLIDFCKIQFRHILYYSYTGRVMNCKTYKRAAPRLEILTLLQTIAFIVLKKDGASFRRW